MATNAAAQNAIKKKLVHKLEVRCWARICRGQANTVSKQDLAESITPLSRGVMSFSSIVCMLHHREIYLPCVHCVALGCWGCSGAAGVGTGEVVWGIWTLVMARGLDTDC